MDALEEIRREVKRHRFRAHERLFPHRHEYPFAPFHRDLVSDFWSSHEFYIDFGFRECGKTTLVEEAIAMAACQGAFRNCLIIGANEDLAAELLMNVKSELENNQALISLYGEMFGDTWGATKITLRDGRCVQSRGVGQRMRGTIHGIYRPDLVVINDFEDDDAVLSPAGRKTAMRWVLKVLLPACDRARRKIRIYDTVRDPESTPMMLHKEAGWPARFIPISYLDEAGEEQSSWPEHPTLTREWLVKERALYARLGELDIWEREYMVNPATQADRTFTSDMIKVEPVPRTWQAVYAMIDPARTVKRTSATTGWAVWSWVKSRLIVWEADAKHMLPDEIVELAFRLNQKFSPVWLGIEENGLNEWLNQPIRAEMAKRAQSIPYRPVSAPRGKIDFIRGLQPFFAGGECVLAAEMPELRKQLMSFPTGAIDAPNALAYALSPDLKPGRLIYDGWNGFAHISTDGPRFGRPIYLAANATRSLLAAALLQLVDGRTRVFQDWVVEGDPGQSLERVCREASWRSDGQRLTMLVGRQHWDQYNNVGLIQAARQINIECRASVDAARGREQIRKDLSVMAPDGPLFAVAPEASWTLNALAGGYCRPLRQTTRLAEEPEPGPYRVLMEGIEAACGLFAWGWGEDEIDERASNVVIDERGRRYRSALPARMRN
jgi:hypothetical protein